jgi:hypothetical protein
MLDIRCSMFDVVPVKAIPPRLTGVKPPTGQAGSNLPRFEKMGSFGRITFFRGIALFSPSPPFPLSQ